LHDFNGYSAIFGNAELLITSPSGTPFSVLGNDTVPAMTLENSNGGEVALDIINGILRIQNTPTYANDAAAGVGGLTIGMIYQTATGELRIKL
jgi:hypothetical protein